MQVVVDLKAVPLHGKQAHTVGRGTALPVLDLGTNPGEGPCTHCTGGWLSIGGSLTGSGVSPHWGLNLGPLIT